MRVLICGDRDWTDREAVEAYVATLPPGSVIIEGECRGADLMARKAAESVGLEVEPYRADWKTFGRAAGPIRNKQMLTEGLPDHVVAFHNDIDNSHGTANMLKLAERAGVTTEVRTS